MKANDQSAGWGPGSGVRGPGSLRPVAVSAATDGKTSFGDPPTVSSARTTGHGPRTTGRGFTLIELIIVIAIIGILATIAVPAMRTAPQRAREAALKEDLFTLRSCIDQFHGDRGRYPASLEELASMGYLRRIPVDPVTKSAESWVVEYEQPSEESDERDQEAGQGIIDVRSGSEDTALDGSKYSEW